MAGGGKVFAAGARQPFLVFTGAINAPGPRQLTLEDGTLWILAKLLAQDAPVNTVAGVRIRAGTIDTDQPASWNNGELRLAAGARCGVTFEPAAEDPASPLTPPPRATFSLAGGVAQVSVTGEARATIFGTTFTLKSGAGGALYETTSQRVLFPLVTDGVLAVAGAAPLASFNGSVQITDGAWAWQTAPLNSNPNQDVSTAILLAGAEGVELTSEVIAGGPTALRRIAFLVGATSSSVIARTATNPLARVRLALWDEAAAGPGAPVIEVAPFVAESPFHVETSGDRRFLRLSGNLEAHLTRPLLASGSAIDLRGTGATVVIVDDSGDRKVRVEWSASPDDPRGRASVAAANALLTITEPRQLHLRGTLGPGSRVTEASLELTAGLYELVPTLPDPYAANFDVFEDEPVDALSGELVATVAWAQGAAPAVQLSIPSQARGQAVRVPAPLPATPDDPTQGVWAVFSNALEGGVPRRPCKLLDVSTGADRLGVCLGLFSHGVDNTPPFSFDGVLLETPGANVHVFALPQVAWEPVRNLPNPLVLPYPDLVLSPDDGDRAQIGVNTVHLIPVSPREAARELMLAHQENIDRAPAAAIFTLPFGIQAVAQFGRLAPGEWISAPSLTLEQARFDGHDAALHFRLRAGMAVGEGPVIAGLSRLPGATTQHHNYTRPGVLAHDGLTAIDPIGQDFNNEFDPLVGRRPQVPVSMVDLSGYGESCFSLWSDELTPPPSVSQVALNVINGRAGREVVQIRSILWPCQALVVRTLTLERHGNAAVVRSDSGWVATTPGLFRFNGSASVFHPGIVKGMHQIREIRDTTQLVTFGGVPFQAVYFDTDVEIENVVLGQNAAGRVPARRQLGFVQRVSVDPGPPPPAVIGQLLQAFAPVGGPVDCVIEMGQSRQRVRVSSIASEVALAPDFAVAAYGMPILPSSGQWSMVRVARSGGDAGVVQAVNPHHGVPLIRANAAGALRFADSRDLLQPGTPLADYGLLHSSPTHRVLFPRPKVEPGAAAVSGAVKPLLADPYAMAGAVGLFPNASACLPFRDAGYELEPQAGGLKMAAPAVVDPLPVRKLADTAGWALKSFYDGPIRVAIDPAVAIDPLAPATWPVQMEKVRTVLDVPPFGELIRIVADVPDLGGLPGQLSKPALALGAALHDLEELLTAVQKMNLPFPMGLSLAGSGLENQTYHLRFNAHIRLATKDGDRIDVGIGKLSGGLEIGGELEASLTGGARGRVFIMIEGDLQQGILPPLLYAGGLLRFSLGIDDQGHTDFQLDVGVAASIGGDLIPGLLSLEATVHYAYLFKPDLRPAVRLGMDARASIASGLLAVKFGVDASVSISRPGPELDRVRIQGDIMAMGQITVAWAFDEDFSRRFRFEQDILLRYAAFAAVSGLLPLPV